MMKYLFTAFAILLVAWWAVTIYLRVGVRTLLAFIALLASVTGFILAVNSLGLKTTGAFIISQVVGFGVILAVVTLFVHYWRKDTEEGVGRSYSGGGR